MSLWIGVFCFVPWTAISGAWGILSAIKTWQRADSAPWEWDDLDAGDEKRRVTSLVASFLRSFKNGWCPKEACQELSDDVREALSEKDFHRTCYLDLHLVAPLMPTSN